MPGASPARRSPLTRRERAAGGVTPTYRFLLVVDGHASRLHPDCQAKAAEIGFDVIIFPGGMTAVLQVMDQVFGSESEVFGSENARTRRREARRAGRG